MSLITEIPVIKPEQIEQLELEDKIEPTPQTTPIKQDTIEPTPPESTQPELMQPTQQDKTEPTQPDKTESTQQDKTEPDKTESTQEDKTEPTQPDKREPSNSLLTETIELIETIISTELTETNKQMAISYPYLIE